jgi:hypothetical protein
MLAGLLYQAGTWCSTAFGQTTTKFDAAGAGFLGRQAGLKRKGTNFEWCSHEKKR